jgi:hypothetical protein
VGLFEPGRYLLQAEIKQLLTQLAALGRQLLLRHIVISVSAHVTI